MKKYLIITGGSRGIGYATIKRFIQEDYQIINISRNLCKLPGVTNLSVDLNNLHSIEQHTAQLQAASRDAEVVCLVHNAAHLKKDSVDSMSLNVLSETLQVNLIAPVLINKICIPFMKGGSSIIYIGSALSEMAVFGFASYIISKHAQVGLMRATCQDLASKDIRSICICPGFVDTQLLKDSIQAETIDWLTQNKVIAKRLIKPNEIAELIFNCSQAPIINGEIIHADLGQVGA